MFVALRSKIQNVQNDLSSRLSVDSLHDLIHCDAGSEVLAKYQHEWQALHAHTVKNAQLAEAASVKAKECQREIDRRCDAYHDFGLHLSQLETLGETLSSLVIQIAEIEGLCEEVETSLAFLDVVCETQDYQEKRLEQRFQLALYREHKVAQLNETKGQLAMSHLHRAEERAKRESVLKREKQQVFQEAFEEDVTTYKKTGRLPGRMVLSKSTPSVNAHNDSLSDVDLEYDPTELNDFLGLSESWSEASASKSQPENLDHLAS